MNKSPLPMAPWRRRCCSRSAGRSAAAEKRDACGLPVAREGESPLAAVKEAAFVAPGVEKAARRPTRAVRYDRKAPAIKSANMFRWQALITGNDATIGVFAEEGG